MMAAPASSPPLQPQPQPPPHVKHEHASENAADGSDDSSPSLTALLRTFLSAHLSTHPRLSLRRVLDVAAQHYGQVVYEPHFKADISNAVTAIVQEMEPLKPHATTQVVTQARPPLLQYASHLDPLLHGQLASFDSGINATSDTEATAAAAAEATALIATGDSVVSRETVLDAPMWEAELYESVRGRNTVVIARQMAVHNQLWEARMAARESAAAAATAAAQSGDATAEASAAPATPTTLHRSFSLSQHSASSYAPPPAVRAQSYSSGIGSRGSPPSPSLESSGGGGGGGMGFDGDSMSDLPAAAASSSGSSSAAAAAPPAANSGFNKPCSISDALSAFLHLSPGTQVSRTWVMRAMSEYVKEHGLQDPKDRRTILCDQAMQELFAGEKVVTYFTLNRYLSPHFAKITRIYKKRPPKDKSAAAAATAAAAAAAHSAKNNTATAASVVPATLGASTSAASTIGADAQSDTDPMRLSPALGEFFLTQTNFLPASAVAAAAASGDNALYLSRATTLRLVRHFVRLHGLVDEQRALVRFDPSPAASASSAAAGASLHRLVALVTPTTDLPGLDLARLDAAVAKHLIKVQAAAPAGTEAPPVVQPTLSLPEADLARIVATARDTERQLRSLESSGVTTGASSSGTCGVTHGRDEPASAAGPPLKKQRVDEDDPADPSSDASDDDDDEAEDDEAEAMDAEENA